MLAHKSTSERKSKLQGQAAVFWIYSLAYAPPIVCFRWGELLDAGASIVWVAVQNKNCWGDDHNPVFCIIFMGVPLELDHSWRAPLCHIDFGN